MTRIPLTDRERQILVSAAINLLVKTPGQSVELDHIIRKLTGVDTRVWVEKP